MSKRIPEDEFKLRLLQILRQAISDDYVDIFLDREIHDGEETSGWETDGVYNDDDIKLAVGRILDEYFFPSLADL